MEKNVENFRAKLHDTIGPNSLSGRTLISEFMILPDILNFLNSSARQLEIIQEPLEVYKCKFINILASVCTGVRHVE